MRSGLTIGLLGQHFGWGGGIDFLRHVADGLLAKHTELALSLHLLLPIENRVESCADLLRVGKRSVMGSIARRRPWLARPQPAFHASLRDIFADAGAGRIKIAYHDTSRRGLLRCLRSIGADVALPALGGLGPGFPVPWVGYIYDFQHRHLPELFSPQDCYEREMAFAATLKDAGSVIVNSRTVRQDIVRQYPWANPDTIISLPFSPHARAGWHDSTTASVRAAYGLTQRYFLVSNQFWIHKDHMTAIRAMQLLGPDARVSLVCTGATEDYRRPGYLQEIQQSIAERGLVGSVHVLGHIPKRDHIEIMKGALAVVQPTLFEGGPGGGSVADALALGVPVLLSDIPVNREVAGDNVFFFRPTDAGELASLMTRVSGGEIARPPRDVLEARAEEHLSRLGDSLMTAIDVAIDSHGPVARGRC